MLAKHKTPLAWIAIACCCLLAAWSATHRLQQSMPRAGTWDFPIFASYANQFLATGMIYDRNLTQYAPGAAIYKFPPLSGSILASALQAGFTENALMALGASLQLAAFSGGILLLTLVLLPDKRLEDSQQRSRSILPWRYFFSLLQENGLPCMDSLQAFCLHVLSHW